MFQKSKTNKTNYMTDFLFLLIKWLNSRLQNADTSSRGPVRSVIDAGPTPQRRHGGGAR